MGRILSGLNALSPSFAVTPPFFDTKTEMEKKKVDDFIKSRLLNSSNVSDGLFAVIRYCFASICYHYSFLTNTLQSTSRIRTSPILINIPEEILSMAKVFSYKQVSGDSNGCAPRLTGIPPHVVMINNLNEVHDHVSVCSRSVVKEVKQELEDRFVGGDRFQANVMLNQVQKIQEDMQSMLENIKNGNGIGIGEGGSSDVKAIEVGEGESRRRMYYWGGKFHCVPKGFEVPRMTLANFITCWFCGCERHRVPPLRFVQANDLGKKNGKVLISQWRRMIQVVKRAAAKVGFMLPRNSNLITVRDTVNLYSAVKHLFRYESLKVNHKRRYEGILWKTVFNIVLKNKGKLVDEI